MNDDLIRRSDAIKAYNEAMDELVKTQMEEFDLTDFTECEFDTTQCKLIARKIEAIPTVEPKQGKWILSSDEQYEYCTCSECGYENGENWMIGSNISYCQNCGAKMKGESDE